MADKRYQVFVSSTFKDLEEERQEVMNALLELDCIPSGMELFPAANEAQWDLIKRVIGDCDYYILILAGRYGSLGSQGFSYTEMEYRYALSINKPIIAFLHREPGKITADKIEATDAGKAKLADFRSLVEKRLCKMWASPQELGSVVSRSLVQLIKTNPAIGWVRANELAGSEATAEILSLRKRIEELQAEISDARVSAPRGSEQLAQGDEVYDIRYKFIARQKRKYDISQWDSTLPATWNEIFSHIAPLMVDEATEEQLRSSLDVFCEKRAIEELRSDEQIETSSARNFHIISDEFHTIKIQLRALGLIVQSTKNRSVKDQRTYWKLTPYGDETMTRLRAIRSIRDSPLPSG